MSREFGRSAQMKRVLVFLLVMAMVAAACTDKDGDYDAILLARPCFPYEF